MTPMDQTASWAVNARMEEFVAVLVDAIVPQGGEDRTVKSLVGIVIIIWIFLFSVSSFTVALPPLWNEIYGSWYLWYILYIFI